MTADRETYEKSPPFMITRCRDVSERQRLTSPIVEAYVILLRHCESHRPIAKRAEEEVNLVDVDEALV